MTATIETHVCACNCGTTLTPGEAALGRRFKRGHRSKATEATFAAPEPADTAKPAEVPEPKADPAQTPKAEQVLAALKRLRVVPHMTGYDPVIGDHIRLEETGATTADDVAALCRFIGE